MEFHPKVSIIIPCHNYGHFISETLTNLLKQTLTEWEAIIIDDGSTDNTKAVVKAFCSADSRFNYIYQKKSGVSVARNLGLKYSSGKYIQFLDADDMISEDKLIKQVEHLESNPKISISYCRNYYFDHNHPQTLYLNFDLTEKADLTKENEIRFTEIGIDELIEENPLVINAPLIKKEIYLQGISFTEGNGFVEDWEFWINCVFNNHQTAYCDSKNSYSLVRRHIDSTSTNVFSMKLGEGRLRKKVQRYIDDTRLLSEKQKMLLHTRNNKHRLNIYKVLLFNTEITNWIALKKIYSETDKITFLKCFFKALNMKRKLQSQ
jgi:glycosyltransferase involved in cell wall biosynthesis